MSPRAQSWARALSLTSALAAAPGGCHAGPDEASSLATSRGPGVVRASVAASHGLEVFFEIRPEVVRDGSPMHTIVLHFRNASSQPMRIYVPGAAPFRLGISSLYFESHGQRFVEPEPQPHGYTVTDVDFPLLSPGEERSFDQPFTLDPMEDGRPTRRPGFEPGAEATVTWVYENRLTRWAGAAETLDGPTRRLFDGGDIPYIWTGRVTAEATWLSP